MKIGIFGGTFDPFTISHYAIVEKVLNLGLVDVVRIVPTIVNYHRAGKKEWLTRNGRLYIINEALRLSEYRESGRIVVDTIEYQYEIGRSPFVCSERRFIHTLKDIIWNNGCDEFTQFYSILGADSIANFKTWYKWNDILESSKIIAVAGRGESNLVNKELCDSVIDIDKKYSDVSATKMRFQFATGKFDEVENYKSHLIDEIRNFQSQQG